PLHVPTTHAPIVHAGAPPGTAAHALPQPPQLATVVTSVSQPLPGGIALQSANQAAHTNWQTPAAQVAEAALTAPHAIPQPPQFLTVVVEVSHPSVLGAVTMQSAQSGWQVKAHAEPLQVALV